MKEIISPKVIALCIALGLVGCSHDRGGVESGGDTGYGHGSSMTTNAGTMGSESMTNQGTGSMTNGFQHLQPNDTNSQALPNAGAPGMGSGQQSGSETNIIVPEQPKQGGNEDQNPGLTPPNPDQNNSGAPGMDSGDESGNSGDMESTPDQGEDQKSAPEPDSDDTNPSTPDQDNTSR